MGEGSLSMNTDCAACHPPMASTPSTDMLVEPLLLKSRVLLGRPGSEKYWQCGPVPVFSFFLICFDKFRDMFEKWLDIAVCGLCFVSRVLVAVGFGFGRF